MTAPATTTPAAPAAATPASPFFGDPDELADLDRLAEYNSYNYQPEES